MSRINNSVLWEHFVKNDLLNKKAKCNLCGQLISYKTTTGNLKTHLRHRHIEAYRQVATVQLQATATPTTQSLPPALVQESDNNLPIKPVALGFETIEKVSTNQTKLDTYIPRKMSRDQKSRIDNDLLDLFCKGFQPFSLVEEPSFINFCRWIPGYKLPSRKQVSSTLIPQLYQKTKIEVQQRLSSADEVETICLTMDLWTSRGNESYMAITGHFINTNFEMSSVLLACDNFTNRHTSDNIKTFIVSTAANWNLTHKINFVISDNAANIQKAIQDLGWKHFGCFGHTLNLIVQKSLICVQSTLEKVKAIVRFFKKSTFVTEKLLKYQKQENETAIPLKLKQDMPTRWNSTFHMIRHFVQLQTAIQSTTAVIGRDLPIITNEEWVLLEQLSMVLKPFDDVTSAMSGEKYITGGSIIIITRCLIKTCDKLLEEHVTPLSDDNEVSPAAIVAQNLREGLTERLGNVERSGTFGICTFLDPRYKTSRFQDKAKGARTKKKVQDLVQNMIAKKYPQVAEPTSSQANISQKGVSPWSILSEIIQSNKPQRTGTPLAKAIQEVDLYLEDDMLDVHNADGSWNCPLQWWRNRHQKYPHLSQLFRRYGNIVATSVPCERIFSKAGQLISDRRTRLDHNKVAQIMFINGNT